VIRLEGITKTYHDVDVVKDVDFNVRKGEWVGLFGHNGSGKTTLIRILLGLTQPTRGRILIDGKPVDPAVWRRLRDRLGFMPERIVFPENVSGFETLSYFARLREIDRTAVESLLDRVGLADAASKKVGEYSKGMKQRLNLAQALLGDPEILVLDEPIEGLDPAGVRQFFELVAGGGGRTVILSSHRLTETADHVDRVGILHHGVMQTLRSVQEVRLFQHLPTKVHIYAPAANGTLEGLVESLGATALTQRNGRLIAEISQEKKMAFLAGLERNSGTIKHTHIEEPNLEQAYLEMFK
jgi:Cu-processing system ATP-binding protein